MIRVTILHAGGRAAGFTVTGHANYAEAGTDIVCSAVSALTETTAYGITQVANIPAGLSVEEDGIHCILEKGTTDEQAERAALLIEVMANGLRAIEESYPGTLKITDREV